MSLIQRRCISSSPYGRTHVWKRRDHVLPNPVVPKYPQRVILSNGASFTHFTTSPRSLLRLTRDTTNHPMWNTYLWADEGAMEDEANTTGRLGRFNRRFEGVGGVGRGGTDKSFEWMQDTRVARADPWPLPHTPEHMANTTISDDLPRPIPRHNESIDTMRARLVYQSRKRGTLESDLLLSTFARDHLSTMSESELREYDKMLDEPDWDIYYWATGKRTPPERWSNSSILERLRVHAKNEGKVVRKMPAL